MKKWITILFICFVCGHANATLIRYEITNFYTEIDTGVESVSPMEVLFNDDEQTLLSCILTFDSRSWFFSSDDGIAVAKSPNAVGSQFEIFMLFSPIILTSGGDEAIFSANEWKILDTDPDADAIANLGRKGPSGIGFLTVDGRNYGVTSRFDQRTAFEVPEPSVPVLAAAAMLLMLICRRDKRISGE